MIEIGDAGREQPPELERASGSFAWWYADLVTPRGDGAVLIWSYGLPFLPGYAAAARAGHPQPPRSRPSVNLVAYRGGKANVYLLQEVAREDADGGTGGEQRIGACRFRRRVDGGRLRLDAELDCPLPGTRERLTGELRLAGTARAAERGTHSGGAAHVWTPLTGPAEGEMVLRMGARTVADVRGRAYHDRNHGGVPLHDLGIGRWIWARFPLPDRERIVYLLWPEDGGEPRCLALELGADGRTERLDGVSAYPEGRRWTALGPSLPACLRLRRVGRAWATLRPRAPVDAGPFYLRFLCDMEDADGRSALGWGELCHPARVDLPLHRPLVRMRVHRAGRRNSPWLPLFSGPRQGRAGRLWRHLLAGWAA